MYIEYDILNPKNSKEKKKENRSGFSDRYDSPISLKIGFIEKDLGQYRTLKSWQNVFFLKEKRSTCKK